MPIEKTPYEFLVRFKKNGAISGAHIKFFETISEGGVVLLEREGMAQPVETAYEAGFPMSMVLNAVELGAIKAFNDEVAAHAATLAEKNAELDAFKQDAAADIELLKQQLNIAAAAHAAMLAEKNAEMAAKLAAQSACDELQRKLEAEIIAHTTASNRLSVLESQLAAQAG